MSGKTAAVIGGGNVAYRKVKALLAAGAELLVVAPEVIDEISRLGKAGRVAVTLRHYQAGDLEGAFLAVAATDDAGVNRQVVEDAGLQGKLICVADAPDAGNCSFPALLRRGSIEVAVSTGGGCPTLAIELRDLIADIITEGYEDVLGQLAEEREKLLTEGNSSTYNARVLRSLTRQLISALNERKDTA